MKNQGWLFTRAGIALFATLAPLLLCFSQAATAQPKPLSAEHRGPLLSEHIHFAIDLSDEGNLPIDRISSLDWRQAPRTPLNLGYKRQPVWLHLRLQNRSQETQTRVLELGFPLLDDIQVWVFSDRKLQSKSHLGDRYPFSDRAIRHRNNLHSIELAGGGTTDLYLRVASSSSLQLPLSLWSPEDLAGVTANHYLLTGIYYGTLLVMLLYNLSIYINGRDIKYLCYVAYLVSIGLFFASINGLGFQYLWPGLPALTNNVVIGSLGSTLLFASLFTAGFLNLANTRPCFNRAMQLIAAGAALIIIAGALLPYYWVIQPAIALTLLASILTLASCLASWRDGHSSAMLFTMAWIALLAGTAMLGLSILGWLPRNPVTAHTAQIGSMIEFVLFSLALIKQLNAERQAKFAAQRSSLAFERQASESRQQALELQRQTTEQLELRVRQRTLELQALNEKLRALSTTDPLTGLRNRRYFNERFLAEFSRSKRDGTPITVIIIDVDHFKAVNDTHGHLMGDELLKVVAKHISAQAKRESDIIARHGGEEFSAVLIKNSPEDAHKVAEKIRRRVAMACYQTDDLSLRCTVSIGIATMVPQKHSVAEELLKQADDALYRAKADGRNCVSIFSKKAA